MVSNMVMVITTMVFMLMVILIYQSKQYAIFVGLKKMPGQLRISKLLANLKSLFWFKVPWSFVEIIVVVVWNFLAS